MVDQPEEQSMQMVDLEKKLQKRESRMLERLQDARTAQARALERFQRATVRLQKRMAKVQRVEARLAVIQQQLEELRERRQSSPNEAVESEVELPQWASRPGESEPVPDELEAALLDVTTTEEVTESETAHSPQEVADRASEARSIAEATELAARLAAERASAIAAQLEQFGSGRHLSQELIQVQLEADQARALAEEAETLENEEEDQTLKIPRLQQEESE